MIIFCLLQAISRDLPVHHMPHIDKNPTKVG